MDTNQEVPSPFPQWLRRQIDRRGWSGAELGRQMGVPTGTVNNWLRGDRRLTDADLIHRMAEALNVHQDEILEQLDLRGTGADHMSLSVRRLAPTIDRYNWTQDQLDQLEGVIDSLGRMHAGTFEVPIIEE